MRGSCQILLSENQSVFSNQIKMAAEKFSLKWNEYQENFASSFQGFRTDPDFSDVTLVCEESRHIEAHRVILSTCSPFFSSLLRKNKHSHPMIYMRGLKAKDLATIIDFIYYGEVNILQEDIDAFLALAHEFKLKGLTGSNEKYLEIVQPIQKDQIDYSNQAFNNLKIQTHGQASIPFKEETIDYSESESSHESNVIAAVADRKQSVLLDENMKNIAEQIDSMIETLIGEDFKWKCRVCGKGTKSRQKRDMSRHVETHIEGISYPCDQCDKINRLSHALIMQDSRDHSRK